MAAADLDDDGSLDLAVAANTASVSGFAGAGRVDIFLGNRPFPHAPDFMLTDPTPETGGSYGRFLTTGDVNGDGVPDLIVPSYRSTIDGQFRAGKVLVYLGGTLHTTPDLLLNNPEPEVSAQFGGAVAAGDVNGDGFADIAVGSYQADVSGIHDAGKVYLFLGGSTPNDLVDFTLTEPTPETYTDTPSSGADFGRDVAIADVNADGYADVIAAAAFASVDGHRSAGRVQVFLGGASFNTDSDFTLTEPHPDTYKIFGWNMRAGDVNGDGYPDLVIGAPSVDPIPGNPFFPLAGSEGRVQIFFGGPHFDAAADLTLTEPTPTEGAQFGRDMIAIGDINHDGKPDVAIAAPFAAVNGKERAGRVQVFFGGRRMDARADLTVAADSPEANANFGLSGVFADVDEDGTDAELIVGSPFTGGAGAVMIFIEYPGAPPAAPSHLEIEALAQNKVRLTWQDNSSQEQAFVLERKVVHDRYSVIAILPANTTSYVDKIKPNLAYKYRVSAINQYGSSGFSDPARTDRHRGRGHNHHHGHDDDDDD